MRRLRNSRAAIGISLRHHSTIPIGIRASMRVSFPRYDCLMQVVQRASRLFDVGADPLHVGRHLRRDHTFAGMVARRPGLRVPGAWDGFELAVRSILGQRLGIVDSPALVEKLVQRFGRAIGLQLASLSRLFPLPDVLAKADLTGLGVPRQQAETIAALAHAVSDRKLTFDGYQRGDLMLAALRCLPNITDDALSYIAMRALGDPNAFPEGDTGLHRPLRAGGIRMSGVGLQSRFEGIRPWRACAAMHLWAATEQARGPNCARRNLQARSKRSKTHLAGPLD